MMSKIFIVLREIQYIDSLIDYLYNNYENLKESERAVLILEARRMANRLIVDLNVILREEVRK
ncbi:hypothetical protein SPV2_gp14 [Sulfolobus polyhedral virus 2]|uniref:Uncharacterized protein n=1 Tax=Sulfolobus polyhedral virus 2 TaxID=2493125 RepID=A0A3Q8Q9P5_9VIRU|nr:hypothetical protein KM458_gp14 [Sulfolobus polyhedral virus 2]AZI76013.1 hypothetical protein SPV2_gp14 [Sulfolobus polyhedral virus 2]